MRYENMPKPWSSNGRGFIARPRSRRGILQSGSCWTGFRRRETNTRASPPNPPEPTSPKAARAREDETSRRLFVLRYVQPGLAGLMDGSVSTLAPLFAAAFATHNTWQTFLVGLAASVGAGISMGFAEALSDDGSLTGRGAPLVRGAVCGLMTTVGGLGHTLPYLIPDFFVATIVSVCVVAAELAIISFIRHRFMDTPFLAAAFQVVVGGVLVFIAGIAIGSSYHRCCGAVIGARTMSPTRSSLVRG